MFQKPLSDTETSKIVHSIWKYKIKGKLWTGSEAKVQITDTELNNLADNSDAVFMLLRLRAAHSACNDKTFAISKAFATTLGWTLPRFRKARTILTDRLYINNIHPGGRGPNDPPLYRLNTKRGAKSCPNITKHLFGGD